MVLDSRASSISNANNNNPDMNLLDEDWERMVMEMGTAKECCQAVNEGKLYGPNCVVANEDGIIQWDWFSNEAQ